ncbi:L-rhamnose isomerase [Salmonella enterica subsp. enterica]|nr:L-rhamnose isomerase [Salmonella enterica subsp. enterica]
MAKQRFRRSIDVEALRRRSPAISMHCWQGDDVAGFEGGRLS